MAPPSTLVLNDGRKIPMIAFGSGTAHIRSKSKKDPSALLGTDKLDRDIVDAVKSALREGYRHLDNAEMYGTEAEVGLALRESIDEGIIANRRDVFITSKVSENPIEAEKAIDSNLERLGGAVEGYVDLYLIHTPYFTTEDADLQKAWAAMERVQASGKALSIGISNYESNHIQATLATAKIKPAINQIEFHPYMTQRDGTSIAGTLRTGGVALSAYGVVSPITRNIPGPLDSVLARLAAKYGRSTGVICMRWCIEQDIVVITTSQKPSRMREYMEVFDFALTSEEVEEITTAGSASLGDQGELKPRILKYYEELNAQKAAT